MYGSYGLNECVPYELRDAEFSQEISELSPDFCAIANQARNAEELGLLLIAGGGYRKALEFLVKDYAIRLGPGDAEQIKKIDLGPYIQNYISNPMVKDTLLIGALLSQRLSPHPQIGSLDRNAKNLGGTGGIRSHTAC